MIYKSKTRAIEYIQSILNMDMVVSYYRLKTFFEKNQIVVKNVKVVDIRGMNELSLVSIDNFYEDESVDLTLNSESLMNFLPLLYHDKEFLRRYLFGIQSSMLNIEDMIYNMSNEFTAQNSHYIDWLSSWFGIEYGDIIGDKSKRQIVANAVELYKQRGTKIYFIKLIKALVDVDIEIDDDQYSQHNRGKSTKNQRAFSVIIGKKISEDCDEESRIYSIIKNIFNKEKPVNTKLYINYSFDIESDGESNKKILSFNDGYDY